MQSTALAKFDIEVFHKGQNAHTLTEADLKPQSL